MNERWIKTGHHDAECYRLHLPSYGPPNGLSYCLFIIGLFETSWMIFDHENHPDQREYGYPKKA